jgi:hypothetical protein
MGDDDAVRFVESLARFRGGTGVCTARAFAASLAR